MTLAIIICTNNRYGLLEKALDSAIAQEIAVDEIIVVDNSTDRDQARSFACRFSGSQKIRFAFEENQNLSHARNAGAALARSKIVAFMDDDAIAEPGWASALTGTFNTAGSGTGCVGGRVKPIWPSAPPTWLTPTLAGYLSIVDWGDRQRELAPGEWLAGCNIAFNRQALLDIGGFRTDIGRTGNSLSLMSNEETSAWQALKRAGYKVLYSPQAVVSHHIDKKRLDTSWLSRRIAWQAVSDAISDPEFAMEVANYASPFNTTRKLIDSISRLRRNVKSQRRLTDADAKNLHALVMVLLCNGVENPAL